MKLFSRVRLWPLSSLLLVCLLHPLQAGGDSEPVLTRQDSANANHTPLTLEERRAALSQLQEAARRFLDSGQSSEAARALNRVGRLQLTMNNPQEAIEAHNQALKLLTESPSKTIEIDSLNGLAAAHMRLQKLEDAEVDLRRAISLSKEPNYTAGEAEALLILSDRQNYQNHVLALQTAQEALSLWLTLDDKSGRARSHFQIGECYLAQNMVSDAEQNYAAALQLAKELNDPLTQAANLIALGFVEFRKGEWEKDISYLTQAQGLIDEDAEPLMMGQITGGLAEAFNESGLPEQGLFHFQQTLVYFRQTKNPVYAGYALWGIGWSDYLLEKYPEALAQSNLALAEGGADSILAAQCHQLLGRVLLATGEPAEALRHLQLALNVYATTVNPREAAQTLALMGQAYQQQGQLDRATKSYDQSLATFTRLSDRVNEAVVNYALGALEMKKGNYDKAENYLGKSISLTENLRLLSTSRDLTAAFSATVHGRYESYIDCLMRKNQTKRDPGIVQKAFEISELGRARSLSELLRATKTNLVPGLDPELSVEEKSLRQSLKVKEDAKITLLANAYKKEDLDALENELSNLETRYKQVTEKIRSRYPAYDQITRPTVWSLTEIQEKVIADDQTVLLEYSLGKEKSYLWAVTRNQITSYELPSEARITEAAEKLYGLLATSTNSPNDSGLMEASQQLSQMILSPVATDLNRHRVIVVADGALHYIPFQILPISTDGNVPLVANTEVVNTASASILGQLQHEATQRQGSSSVLAAFGDPVFATNYAQRKPEAKAANLDEEVGTRVNSENARGLHALRDIEPRGDTFDPAAIQPLFYAKRELANLRDVAGLGTLMVTGFDATRENLARVDLTKYAILHFATHGVLDPKRPQNSGLFLSMVDRQGKAQNGFVELQDIYSLHAPVDLVVLSACRTGLGRDVRGEGLIGLTRGFMYAGASSVVASLWKVDDEATAELMKRFYTNMLQRGMTPAAALRAAQNSIRQEPLWNSPYYWAAFTLQGEYRQVIKTSVGSDRQVYLIFAVVLLTLLATAIWRFRRHRGKAVT